MAMSLQPWYELSYKVTDDLAHLNIVLSHFMFAITDVARVILSVIGDFVFSNAAHAEISFKRHVMKQEEPTSMALP